MTGKVIMLPVLCAVLLDKLGQIDLGSLGIGPETKEKIEILLQVREVLLNLMEILPWGTAIAERSTEVELGALALGTLLLLAQIIVGVLRFAIGAGILVAVAVLAFTCLQNHTTALAGMQIPTGPRLPIFSALPVPQPPHVMPPLPLRRR